MPPEIKTDRQTMLDGVIAMIDECGYESVTARSVAERLGISTQPIYREFGDMEELKRAATERGWRFFTEYVSGAALDQSVRYVMFACEHSRLFNFLFRNGQCEYEGLNDLAHKLADGTDIIERLEKITALPRERVYRLHLCVWMALHGLAAMSADNKLSLTHDEISEFTKDMTKALTAYYGEK